jgi:type I restriction enzyme S subunit
MSEWKNCTLGDILTFQRGHDLPKKQMNAGEYPVVGSNGIIGYHNEYTTEEPSITIGRSGNTGNPYIVHGKSWSHNTTLYIKEFKGSDPIFVYYLLKTLDLGNFAGGSAVPTLNRNHIHTLDISVPPLAEQIEIGRTLSVLDAKIATNTAINHNLGGGRIGKNLHEYSIFALAA